MGVTYEELYEEYYSYSPPKRSKKFEYPSIIRIETPKFQDISISLYIPTNFEEYIGQTQAKKLLQIMLKAAKIEQRPIPNIMITGTAGLGKTSLARIILKEEPYKFTDGNTLNAGIDGLSGYVIVDEIHNIKPEVCDALNLVIDNGTVRIIGCTTNPGMLTGPFRTRFRTINLLPYSIEDLILIMQKVLERRDDLIIPYKLLEQVASRGRRTPRVTLHYLSFITDLMLVEEQHTLTQVLLDEAFLAIGVDELGLLSIDRKYLEAFPEDGRAVGLQFLCALVSCDKETIEQEIEPYLLSLKLIDRTSRGRVRINEDYLDAIIMKNMFRSK